MFEVISSQLDGVERACNVKVLYAIESGSRSWGFASPDSDYDVRFVYARTVDDNRPVPFDVLNEVFLNIVKS